MQVSPLCFGTLPFSPLQGYAGGTEAAAEVLCHAFERGINFLDTAQLYENYDVIKTALARTNNDIVVTSKTYAYTSEGAADAVEEARCALDRDVIDIFLLHEQESEHTLRGHAPALEMLYGLKAKGFIRAVGISTHHVAGVRAAVNAGLDVVHPLLNVAGLGIADGTREEMEQAISAAKNAGLGVYGMKALGGGHLFRVAEAALTYARGWGHSLALGMRDTAEVDAAVTFFETGKLPALSSVKPRRLHIADWCEGCGHCVAACKSGALEIVDGKVVCDSNRCVLCGYCSKCPLFCIKVV